MCVPLTWVGWGGNVPSCGVLVSTMMMPLCFWGVRLEMSAEAPQMGQRQLYDFNTVTGFMTEKQK